MGRRTANFARAAITKASICCQAIAASAFALLLGQPVWPDTLELRSGQIIQGKFIAGSVKNIRFQVNGQEMSYPTQDVLNIGFSDQGDASSSSNAAPNDQASPPPQQDAQAASPGQATPPPPAIPAPAETPAATSRPAQLASSSPRPSAAPAAQGQYITIPAGTTVFIRMVDGVDSSQNEIGDTFHASLESAL